MSTERRGRVVVFLGPDGAGKSTVLELVKSRLAAEGTGFASYYFAPGFLRRYRPTGDGSITTNPHEGRQYGPPLIAAKIALMLFEFRLGMPRIRRTQDLALFDRYISDLLVDPRRYRMKQVRWWMRALLALAPKPDLTVVISAPAEQIQARKQEVPFAETERQLAAYAALAARLPNAFVVENTAAPEVAAEAVLARIAAT